LTRLGPAPATMGRRRALFCSRPLGTLENQPPDLVAARSGLQRPSEELDFSPGGAGVNSRGRQPLGRRGRLIPQSAEPRRGDGNPVHNGTSVAPSGLGGEIVQCPRHPRGWRPLAIDSRPSGAFRMAPQPPTALGVEVISRLLLAPAPPEAKESEYPARPATRRGLDAEASFREQSGSKLPHSKKAPLTP